MRKAYVQQWIFYIRAGWWWWWCNLGTGKC